MLSLVSVFTLLATLLLAELAMRGAASVLNKSRGVVFDKELGWRLVPGVTKMDSQWCDELPAKTNSLGWRDEEFSPNKTVGVTRIVTLGDSFTFGYGVDFGSRFSEVMEDNVPNLEVVNMGVFAYGTDQEVLAYELDGRQYQPDIVLLNVYLGNDLDDLRLRVCHSFPKPYFTLDDQRLRLVKPTRTWPLLIRSHSYVAEFTLHTLEGGTLRSEVATESQDADVVALFVALVERLAVETTKHDSKLLVVMIHPQEPSEADAGRTERVLRELAARPLGVLDLDQPFRDRTSEGEELYLPDGHWNIAGHRLAAESIQAELARRGWISARADP